MDKVCRVVALGGGYLTMYALKALRRQIRKGRVEFTVIDRNNYHVFHGLVPEILVGKVLPGNIISPARVLFKDANFHNVEIESVDFKAKKVTTSRYLDGRQYKVPFDHLIIGLGSCDNLSRYAGVAENTFRLKSYNDIFDLKNHIITSFELAEIEPDKQERQRLLTFVVAGANYAGVEVASEISEYAELLTSKYYQGVSGREVKVILLNPGDSILPELNRHYPKLVDYARRFVSSQVNIEIRNNTKIESATPIEAIADSGEIIPTRTIISCTGNAQSPLFDRWKFKRDDFGRLQADEFCNVLGQSDIWVGGDCGSIPHPKGGACPPLAIYAMTSGKHIGKNIAKLINGKRLKKYSFTGLGDACSLSRRRAVGHLYGIQVKGFFAWLTWRIFMFAYLPVWNRRIRVLFDWIIWPFIGRDLVSMSANHQVNIKELYFEAGQTIIKQGESGNGMFVIYSGEVDVYKDQAKFKTPKKIATLQSGEFFGEVAIFKNSKRTATVKAKTKVKLLEIKRDAAVLLKDSMKKN